MVDAHTYSMHNRSLHQRNGGGKAAAYQIDCQTSKKGRMFAGTKRRICWRFGFSNAQAVDKGLSGSDCRGEEHEVVFVWSLTSGKKFVLADGHEVHWSKESALAFDSSWQWAWQAPMAGATRELTVVARASSHRFDKKKTNGSNGSVSDSSFRRIDLLVDGVPFSELPQVFELGGKNAGDSGSERKRAEQRPMYGYNNDYDVASLSVKSLTLPLERQQPRIPRPQVSQFRSYSTSDLMGTDLSSSPTCVMGGETIHQFPFYPCATQQQLQQHPYRFSPTSIAGFTTAKTTNPFDLYAASYSLGSHVPCEQPREHQQIRTQYDNHYTPHPQNQHPTVY
eukprot:jgi/Psemu1/70006/estExt_Genemark1.C_12700004